MKIHEFGNALFGEHYSANQFAKILINSEGDPISRKTVQAWIDRGTVLPNDIVIQLKKELINRENLIKNLLNSM